MPRTRTPVRTAARPLAAVALTMAVLTTGVLTTNALTAGTGLAVGCPGAASHGASNHGVAALELVVARLERRVSRALGDGHARERSCPAAVKAGRPGTRSARPPWAPWPGRAG